MAIVLAALIALFLLTALFMMRGRHRHVTVEQLVEQLQEVDLSVLRANGRSTTRQQLGIVFQAIVRIRHNAAILLALMESCTFTAATAEERREIEYNLAHLRRTALSARLNGLIAMMEIGRLWLSAGALHYAVNAGRQYEDMMGSGVQIFLLVRPDLTPKLESAF